VAPPALIPEITDATCINGNLLIEPLAHTGYGWGLWPFPAWTFASFPYVVFRRTVLLLTYLQHNRGKNYHTYDFNLFFGNIRENARDRVIAWHKIAGKKLAPVA